MKKKNSTAGYSKRTDIWKLLRHLFMSLCCFVCCCCIIWNECRHEILFPTVTYQHAVDNFSHTACENRLGIENTCIIYVHIWYGHWGGSTIFWCEWGFLWKTMRNCVKVVLWKCESFLFLPLELIFISQQFWIFVQGSVILSKCFLLFFAPSNHCFCMTCAFSINIWAPTGSFYSSSLLSGL